MNIVTRISQRITRVAATFDVYSKYGGNRAQANHMTKGWVRTRTRRTWLIVREPRKSGRSAFRFAADESMPAQHGPGVRSKWREARKDISFKGARTVLKTWIQSMFNPDNVVRA